ncbi:hypothetical protein HDU67_002111 [Dinochytrium kinnereticum]|nr:hypothetical protein HDU67_002111 [Dinochytrium kinnereticum]
MHIPILALLLLLFPANITPQPAVPSTLQIDAQGCYTFTPQARLALPVLSLEDCVRACSSDLMITNVMFGLVNAERGGVDCYCQGALERGLGGRNARGCGRCSFVAAGWNCGGLGEVFVYSGAVVAGVSVGTVIEVTTTRSSTIGGRLTTRASVGMTTQPPAPPAFVDEDAVVLPPLTFQAPNANTPTPLSTSTTANITAKQTPLEILTTPIVLLAFSFFGMAVVAAIVALVLGRKRRRDNRESLLFRATLFPPGVHEDYVREGGDAEGGEKDVVVGGVRSVEVVDEDKGKGEMRVKGTNGDGYRPVLEGEGMARGGESRRGGDGRSVAVGYHRISDEENIAETSGSEYCKEALALEVAKTPSLPPSHRDVPMNILHRQHPLPSSRSAHLNLANGGMRSTRTMHAIATNDNRPPLSQRSIHTILAIDQPRITPMGPREMTKKNLPPVPPLMSDAEAEEGFVVAGGGDEEKMREIAAKGRRTPPPSIPLLIIPGRRDSQGEKERFGSRDSSKKERHERREREREKRRETESEKRRETESERSTERERKKKREMEHRREKEGEHERNLERRMRDHEREKEDDSRKHDEAGRNERRECRRLANMNRTRTTPSPPQLPTELAVSHPYPPPPSPEDDASQRRRRYENGGDAKTFYDGWWSTPSLGENGDEEVTVKRVRTLSTTTRSSGLGGDGSLSVSSGSTTVGSGIFGEGEIKKVGGKETTCLREDFEFFGVDVSEKTERGNRKVSEGGGWVSAKG